MALKNPVYLDLETLLAQAEYNDVRAPVQADIVEKTVKQRSGKANLGYGGLGAGGSTGSEVEFQTSYTMTPTEKATVSKIIDGLIRADVVSMVPVSKSLVKDDLFELEGTARITAASLAGKLFNLLFQYLKDIDQDITNIQFTDIAPDIKQLMQKVYLGNELVPIPLLIELENTGLEQKVFVNLRPSFFIENAPTGSCAISWRMTAGAPMTCRLQESRHRGCSLRDGTVRGSQEAKEFSHLLQREPQVLHLLDKHEDV